MMATTVRFLNGPSPSITHSAWKPLSVRTAVTLRKPVFNTPHAAAPVQETSRQVRSCVIW